MGGLGRGAVRSAGFLRPIACRRTGDYDKAGRAIWQLTEDLCFYSAKLKCWVITPKGFFTNFASVPRLPIVYWWYGDRVWEEPAGHDFPYTTHKLLIVPVDKWEAYLAGEFEPVEIDCDKRTADDLFLEALLANPKTPDGMDHTMHKGVAWFGQSSWDAETTIEQPSYIAADLVAP
jgi:hypothetical protein